MGGERESFFFRSEDVHLLYVENLCLFNSFGNSGQDGGHGEDHGGKCWSSPSKNWSMRVTSSVIPALAARFWKLVIYFWNPSSGTPSRHLKDFWGSLVSSKQAVALVLKGKNVELKFLMDLSKVFSVEAMVELAILSYQILEKGIPCPLLILLSTVMIIRSLVV